MTATPDQVLKAAKAGKLESPVSGWILKKMSTVNLDTPLDEVKRVMLENDGRDVLVSGHLGKLVGESGRLVLPRCAWHHILPRDGEGGLRKGGKT